MATHATVTLRLPRPDDAITVTLAQAELAAESFQFVFEDPNQPWTAYVEQVQRESQGVDLSPGLVPATFLFAEVNGEVVGRVSIRHELNDYLERFGGHIGYAVRPAYRRRGYATAILRQSLEIAHALGLKRVLMICEDSNTASIRTIESCHGVLERMDTSSEGRPIRRYWIELGQAT